MRQIGLRVFMPKTDITTKSGEKDVGAFGVGCGIWLAAKGLSFGAFFGNARVKERCKRVK